MDISSRSDESHEEDSHGEDSRDSDSGSAETADRPPTTRPSPCRKATGRKKKQPSSVLLVKKLRRLHIRVCTMKKLHPRASVELKNLSCLSTRSFLDIINDIN